MFSCHTDNNGTTAIILNERDIVNLLSLLQKYSFKWNEIGLKLGFIAPELHTISSMSRLFVGAPVSYLQELLSQWLQWPTDSHPSKPTLEALCAALRSSLVGLGNLAEKLNEQMKPITGNDWDLLR